MRRKHEDTQTCADTTKKNDKRCPSTISITIAGLVKVSSRLK